ARYLLVLQFYTRNDMGGTAQNLDGDDAVRLRFGEKIENLLAGFDRLAIQLDDEIAAAHARSLGRAAGNDGKNYGAMHRAVSHRPRRLRQHFEAEVAIGGESGRRLRRRCNSV